MLGGLGFIGSNLGRRLVGDGADVILLDSLERNQGGSERNVAGIEHQARIEIGDARDQKLVARLVDGADVVFNLVGQTSHLDSMEDPHRDLEANCRAQLSILESVRHHRPSARIVFAGTRQIYGRPQYLPVDESHPVVPVDVNGIHKYAGDEYHRLYGEVYGLAISTLRLTNTYGPRMRVKDARQTFLGMWLRSAILGDELTVFGDGSQRRDLNYVDDVVDALLLAATDDRARGRVFNLGSNEVVTLHELAELVTAVAESGTSRFVPFPPDRAAIDIGDYFGDFGRIKAELGWEPSVSLREGLSRSIEFLRRESALYFDG